MVVVGTRGLGAVKRTALSLIGLGSVSDHLVHKSGKIPVVVVPCPAENLLPEEQPRPPVPTHGPQQ